MILNSIKLFIVLTICSVDSLSAQEAVDKMDWRDCLEETLRQQPALIAARYEVDRAISEVTRTRSALFPQISGRASYSYSKSSGDNADDSWSYSISGDQLIFDGLESWYDTGKQQQNLVATRYDYILSSAESRLSLRKAFIDLLEAQQLREITRDIVERRRQQLDMVNLRYEAGSEHKGSLLTSRANLSQAVFDLESAQRDILIAQRNLSREMGRDEFTPLDALGDLTSQPVPSVIPAFTEIAGTHPSVLKEAAYLEAAGYDLKSARAGFFPSIHGSASIGRRGDSWPPETENWSAGLSLSLPIFTGGSRIADVNIAEAALEQTRQDDRETRNDTIYYLEEAWKQLINDTGRVRVEDQFLEADLERARISEAQYATGLLSFDNWIIIEDNLVRTRKSHLGARADALRSRAEWEYRSALTIEQELEAVEELP